MSYETERKHLEDISPKSLPDNTAESGLSSAQIKEKFYAPLLYLHDLITELKTSSVAKDGEIEASIQTIDTSITSILSRLSSVELSVDQYSTLASQISSLNTSLNNAVGDISTLRTSLSAVSNLITQLSSDITNGVVTAYKAVRDGNGNIISSTYATKSEANQTKAKADGLESGSVIAGKASKDQNGDFIHSTYVKKSDIVDAVNDTSTSKPLSANQGKVLKGLIDAIELVLQSNDTDLDTIQEIVTYVKNNKSLIDNITTSKVSVSDIVDNLTSEITNKPVSAKQAYILKGLVDDLTEAVNNIVVDDEMDEDTVNPVQGKVIYKELQKKADIAKHQPTMHVGLSDASDALTPYSENSGVRDTTPFNFQTSGGSSDVGSKVFVRALRGHTIKWNQLVNTLNSTYFNFDDATGSFSDGVATFTASAQYGGVRTSIELLADHVYLVRAKIKKSVATDNIVLAIRDSYVRTIASTSETTDYQFVAGIRKIETASSSNNIVVYDLGTEDFASVDVKEIECFDLTNIYGADNEPSTVLEFNRDFPKPHYAFNEGQLLSCKKNGVVNVEYNAFNEELEGGEINASTGEEQAGGNAFRSADFVEVIAGQEYTLECNSDLGATQTLFEYDGNQNYIGYSSYIGAVKKYTLTDNTHYVKFMFYKSGSSWSSNIPSNAEICFHSTWDESKTGYEPYKKHVYVLSDLELRSVGSVYDELLPSGKLTRKVGVVDLGALTENDITIPAQTENYVIVNIIDFVANYGGFVSGSPAVKPNWEVNKKFNILTPDAMYVGGEDKSISYSTQNTFYIRDDSNFTIGTATKAQIIQALQGIVLQFEKPSVVSEDPAYKFAEVMDIDDWGTQQFTSTESIPVPQGVDLFYPVDYKAFIDSLGGRPDIGYDASEIVSHAELNNYATTNTDQTITGVKTFDPSSSNEKIVLGNTGNVNNLIKFNGRNSSRYYTLGLVNNFNFKLSNYYSGDLISIGEDGNVQIKGKIYPADNNLSDIGDSSHSYKDLYLSGKIIGLTTITQAQYDALVSGGTVDANTFYFIEE